MSWWRKRRLDRLWRRACDSCERAIAGIRDFSLAKAAHLLWKGLPLGSDGIRLIKEQFPAALYIKAGFDAGFLRYTYLLGEKK